MIYNILKGLHIIAVIAWMAGLLYMPRLFVYHTAAAIGGEMDRVFQIMERKLEIIIMTPAMVVVLILGVTLLIQLGLRQTIMAPWFMLKISGVIFLVAWHLYLCKARRILASGLRRRGERFWRMTNELPIIAATVIVLSVTTKFGT